MFNHIKYGRNRKVLGILAALTAVSIYAGNFTISKYGLIEGIFVPDLVAARYLFASVFLLPMLFFTKKRLAITSLGWKRLTVLALLSGAPYMFILFTGLNFSSAAHGVVLNPGFVPVAVNFILVIFFEKKTTFPLIMALTSIIFGLTLVSSLKFLLDIRVIYGDLLLILSGFLWAIFTVLVSRWKVDPLVVAMGVSFISFIYLPFYFFFNVYRLHNINIELFVIHGFNQGVLNAVIALFLFAYSIRILGASYAALLSPLTPLIGVIMSYLFLDEHLNYAQVLGLIITFLGLIFLALYNLTLEKN